MSIRALEKKVKTLEQLVPIIAELKQQGKTIVSNNGSYDIMHLGHIEGLFYAASLGDVLVVGLNSDKSIQAYKSIHRPINDQNMRVRMIAALACVDYAFIFDETTPLSWLKALQPQIHTNGAEYGSECIEKPVVESYGGVIELLPMVEGYKTSSIIEKIQQCEG